MGIRVGMPFMFLNRGEKKYQKGSRTASAIDITCEALRERWSSDEDLDRSRTKDNIYLTPVVSGKAITAEWTERADNYVQVQKNGKTRKLRADAHIGFGGICKPARDCEYGEYPLSKQIQFCKDSFEVLKELYAEHGMTLDYGVIHTEEGNAHLHYGGHDEDFSLTKRVNLKFFAELNRGKYVKGMQVRGWNVVPLESNYNPETAEKMTSEELKAYKEECIARKKKKAKCGRSSKEYKADKKAEQIIKQAEQKIEEKRQAEQARQVKLDEQVRALQRDKQALIDEQQAYRDKKNSEEQEFQARQDKLEAQAQVLKSREVDIQEKEKLLLSSSDEELTVKKTLFGKANVSVEYVMQLQNDNAALKAAVGNRVIYDKDLKEAAADRKQAKQDMEKARQDREKAEDYRKRQADYIINESNKRAKNQVADVKNQYQQELNQKLNEQANEFREKIEDLNEKISKQSNYTSVLRNYVDRHLKSKGGIDEFDRFYNNRYINYDYYAQRKSIQSDVNRLNDLLQSEDSDDYEMS